MAEVFRGNVTRVAADGVYIEVPDLGIGVEFGPCETIDDVAIVYVPGDRVACATIADVLDDVIILGLLRVPTA